MLKKLLKYDLKSIFKYWWIAAIVSIGLSIAGGLAISITASDKDVPAFISVLVVFSILFAIIGIFAFPILTYILAYVRYYKNFFTDEGYLTFTLPVKRSQLLNSKLISNLLVMFCSGIVIFADIFILIALGVGNDFYNEVIIPISNAIAKLFNSISTSDCIYLCLMILAAIAILILITVFSTLMIFACITFAAVITKKAKVIAAIGIYYVANWVITGFMQLVYIFGITSIGNLISTMPESVGVPTVTIMLYAVVVFLGLLCLLLYTLNYFMLDRKLNLA
ncbi:MAG: hypothetical protein IJN56_04685 [Clostridia bacterium]|nr:hypothetical protein [Clostridia bacterium]